MARDTAYRNLDNPLIKQSFDAIWRRLDDLARQVPTDYTEAMAALERRVSGLQLRGGTSGGTRIVPGTAEGVPSWLPTVMGNRLQILAVNEAGTEVQWQELTRENSVTGGFPQLTTLITQYTTVDVGPGRHFENMFWAMWAMAPYQINHDVSVTFQVYSHDSDVTWHFNHSDGDRIRIVGDEVNPNGCVVTFPAYVHGVMVDNGSRLGYLNGFRFIGQQTGTFHGFYGIFSYYGSSIKIGNDVPETFVQGKVIVEGFDAGIVASKNAVVLASGNSRFAESHDDDYGVDVSGCRTGIFAAHNGSVIFNRSRAQGNGGSGLLYKDVVAIFNGYIFASAADFSTSYSATGGYIIP